MVAAHAFCFAGFPFGSIWIRFWGFTFSNLFSWSLLAGVRQTVRVWQRQVGVPPHDAVPWQFLLWTEFLDSACARAFSWQLLSFLTGGYADLPFEGDSRAPLWGFCDCNAWSGTPSIGNLFYFVFQASANWLDDAATGPYCCFCFARCSTGSWASPFVSAGHLQDLYRQTLLLTMHLISVGSHLLHCSCNSFAFFGDWVDATFHSSALSGAQSQKGLSLVFASGSCLRSVFQRGQTLFQALAASWSFFCLVGLLQLLWCSLPPRERRFNADPCVRACMAVPLYVFRGRRAPKMSKSQPPPRSLQGGGCAVPIFTLTCSAGLEADMMWNQASDFHDADFVIGGPGDTPLVTSTCYTKVTAGGLRPRSASCKVIGWPVLVFSYAQLLTAVNGVVLPVYQDHRDVDDSSSDPALPLLGAQIEPQDLFVEGVAYSWGAFRPPACLDDVVSVRDMDCERNLDDLQIGALYTLLEDARDDCFDLVCQVAIVACEGMCSRSHRHGDPVRISLVDALPCTPFQRTVEVLKTLLPARQHVPVEAWHDWLDCDLSPFHSACAANSSVWAWFCQYSSWYDAPFQPVCIHVYTDGSAGQRTDGLLPPASWAFNVWAHSDVTQAYLGHAYGVAVSSTSPFHLGEVDNDALTGEQLAVAWALARIIEASCAFPTATFVIHFDNLAAGEGAFARFKLPARQASREPTPLSRSTAVLRHCAQAVANVLGRHVPSHSGVAGNELADIIAKFAGCHPDADDDIRRPLWPCKVVRHELAAWAWLALTEAPDLPALFAFESEAARLFDQETSRPFSFYSKSEPIDTQTTDICVHLRRCSLNALSIREYDELPQGLAVTGKRALLKQQFVAERLHVVALQETRVSGDCIQPDADYLMLHSSCTQDGCFGCALWLSKTLPVVVAAEGNVAYFTKEACTVVAAGPRYIVAQIDLPGLPLTLVSAHAPHDGCRQLTADAFWATIGDVVRQRPSGAQLVVLTDSNGHLGSVTSDAVGLAGAELENAAGLAFHTFLLDFGLCLPSTFEDKHTGRHWTWKVGSDAGHRLDYVAVPSGWMVGDVDSRVWAGFEHIHAADDHQPVLMCCSLLRSQSSWRPQSSNKAVRPREDTDPGQLQCFRHVISVLPPVAWDVDVDRHYASFVESTLWCWKACVSRPCKKGVKPFVSQDTLAGLDHRRQLREGLLEAEASLAVLRKTIGLFAFWLQWQGAVPSLVQVGWLSQQLKQSRLRIARTVGLLGWLRVFLRKAVRTDRAAYLNSLAQRVADSTLHRPKQLFAAVYKAFPLVRSKRRSGFCPLPAVLLDDGSRALDASSRLQRWTEHFAQQEGGLITTYEQYGQVVAPQVPAVSHAPTFDISCVPTLVDVEQDLIRLARGKAAGPDAITADLLQLDVSTASRRLLPIFAKASLGCREPVIYKGGCLVTLAKKAHASLNCADFRSILLSSVPGKLLHRSLRRRLIPSLATVTLPLQAGATPGASPDLLILYLTAFQRWAQSTCGRWAVVFFDVKQAYYRTLRQLVVDCDSDEGLLKVLHGLNLPASALCELRDMLELAAATSPLAGHQHLSALLRDLLTGTWFRFDGSQLLAVTHKGTRPGDPAADVLFAFTLATLFGAINRQLSDRGLVDKLPAVSSTPVADGFGKVSCLQFVSWADDFARPFVGSCATEVLDKVSLATQLCSERATSCGIELAYASDETAGVCDERTVHELQVQGTDLLGVGLPFSDKVSGQDHVLPFVSAYKHLGGIFCAAGKPDLEIFLRKATAFGSVRPVRSKLFGNGHIPLSTRRTLLRSLGLSRFIHGSGALHLNQKGHRRLWHASYVALWAHLVFAKRHGKPHSYDVLAISGAPPPHLFLTLQRATLLSRLLHGELGAVLHMLQLEWEVNPAASWFSQVVADIAVVAEWVGVASTLQQCSSPLHELCEQIESCPGWWVAVIKQAIQAFGADILIWKQQPRVLVCPPGGSFRCAVCGDSFPKRSSLAIHQARRHALLAPARHFAPHRQCIACLRTYGTVMLVQAHLRRNPTCLRRAAKLMRPLEHLEIFEAEALDKQKARTVRRGGWQQFQITARAVDGAGPHNITCSDVDSCPDDFSITVLGRVFRPDGCVLDWIDSFLEASSSTAPRQNTSDWWCRRPSSQNSVFA